MPRGLKEQSALRTRSMWNIASPEEQISVGERERFHYYPARMPTAPHISQAPQVSPIYRIRQSSTIRLRCKGTPMVRGL